MNSVKKTCICCPMGCKLIIKEDHTQPSGYLVEGYSCRRGKEYGVKEMTEPDRIITGTIKVKNSNISRLPVKTSVPIPNNEISKYLSYFNNIEVSAPIKRGEVVYKNLLDSNVDLIALRRA